MATHQEVKVKKTKTMTLSIPTAGKGPNGEPLFIGAVDAPARIKGTLTFSSNYECKGNDIYIQYTAMAVAKWSSMNTILPQACIVNFFLTPQTVNANHILNPPP
jgi:hypothetical protein